ncbi:hypothetical protein L202_03961 [Cryptococcus amylolentus CBS 6039]|uniref:Uncharacterized protein n=1 Tax=Cryptococcus amylolentus CBS 6039 TaxID=1295533 RepID=A0A1E3HPN8_9TREE|nr:hypothetical protein L202_03961 [Cryptococcus amylolentus CBS 6039]ODN78318.1 hypothetical protein L202_03961 [Cryptococcus amylolentus CBS 6039]
MSSQVTIQVWPTNEEEKYEESVYTLDGVLQKDIDRSFSDLQFGAEGEKDAYVWSSNVLDPDNGKFTRGSITTCATATQNTKADNDEYISMANEVGEAVRDTLRDTESEWAPRCRTRGDVLPLKRAEKTAFDAFVQSDPERYSHVGLSEISEDTMFDVVMYVGRETVTGANMEDSSHRRTVAGMVLVRDDDEVSTNSEFLSQQPHF